jgi:hypothetical protein
VKKVAWRTTWGGITSVVAAGTAGKAKAVTVRAAREVYPRKQVKFETVRAVRAPEYDGWAELDSTGRCWEEIILRSSLRMEGLRAADVRP